MSMKFKLLINIKIVWIKGIFIISSSNLFIKVSYINIYKQKLQF